MTTQDPRPFDPQKVLYEALLAEKTLLLGQLLDGASEPHASEIRKDIEACESLLRRFAPRSRAT